MTLRRFSIFALCLALAALAGWGWWGRNGVRSAMLARQPASPEPQTPATPPANPVRITSSVTPGMPAVRTASPPSRPVAGGPAATVQLPASRPESQAQGTADLEGVRFMLRDFRTRLGGNPVGSNAEIMRQVMGGNSTGARLGPPAGQSLNDDGELVDRWGTPYFFHQLSRSSMEIRSAGPDRRLWTADDLVTK